MNAKRISANLIHLDLEEAWRYLLSSSEQMEDFQLEQAFADLQASFNRVHSARLHAADLGNSVITEAIDASYLCYLRLKTRLRSMSFNIGSVYGEYHHLLRKAIKLTEQQINVIDGADQSATVEIR